MIEEKDKLGYRTNFLDYLHTLVKWRKLLLINFIIVSVLAVIFSLIIPKTYSARTIIIPPSGGGSILSTITSNLPIGGLLGGMGGYSDETNKFISILKSRTILENTIKKFNLIKRFQYKNMEDAIRLFSKQVDISVSDEGAIIVEVYLTTKFFHLKPDEEQIRNLVADICNYFAYELDTINKQIQTTQARYNRIFIEKRYRQNKEDLSNAEEEMKNFSEKYGVISLPEQITAMISTAADLESQTIIREVELESLLKFLDKNNPKIIQKQTELKELRDRLKEIKLGSSPEEAFRLYPAFNRTPEIGMKYLRLKRELEIQNVIYEFLTQQYEQAKIQEAKDTPTIQILDVAVPPIKKTKPKRLMLVILAALLSIFLTVIYIFTIEYLRDLKSKDYSRYSKFLYILDGINIFKKLPKEK